MPFWARTRGPSRQRERARRQEGTVLREVAFWFGLFWLVFFFSFRFRVDRGAVTNRGQRKGRVGEVLPAPQPEGRKRCVAWGAPLPLSIWRRASVRRRRRHDGPVHHPQPAGAPAVQVHRDGPRRHHQVGVAGEPAPGLVLLLHGALRPAQLLRHRREREQGARPLQPHGEDAAALRAARRQARRVLAGAPARLGRPRARLWPLRRRGPPFSPCVGPWEDAAGRSPVRCPLPASFVSSACAILRSLFKNGK